MNKKIKYSSISINSIAATSLLIFSLIIMTIFTVGIPNNLFAASYGYVNTSGNVAEVYADSVSGAFTDSINISDRSGVMLINSVSDGNIVGDQVLGY